MRVSTAILLFCMCAVPRMHAGATLLAGEPYSYDGVFAGTGHAAVYLSGVCATSPVVLRLCATGETGVVLSRYLGIAGYDWIAIPLIPYLYGVEKLEYVPLFPDKKLVAYLRDQYRRNHLQSIVPDLPNGGAPEGAWYELIGASYLRTIYAFEIESTPEQDAKLIDMLNARANRQKWHLIKANCADFARQILNFYYPHSVHRSIIGDLGVTTPKQLARTLSKYSEHHPELKPSRFVIPQVPGTMGRSKRMRGVLEVLLTSKKYMLPIFMFHPYAAATAVAVYAQHWHFNLGKNAPALDAGNELVPTLAHADRHTLQQQLDEMFASESPRGYQDKRQWASLQASAVPGLDSFGAPVLQVELGGELTTVGVARSNILSTPAGSEFTARLLQARLRQELTSGAAHKSARTDVERDLELLQTLLTAHTEVAVSTAALSKIQNASAPTIH